MFLDLIKTETPEEELNLGLRKNENTDSQKSAYSKGLDDVKFGIYFLINKIKIFLPLSLLVKMLFLRFLSS